MGKKKSPKKEQKIELLPAKGDTAIAEANAITPIKVVFNDGYVIGTTVQKVDDVLLEEKLRKRGA